MFGACLLNDCVSNNVAFKAQPSELLEPVLLLYLVHILALVGEFLNCLQLAKLVTRWGKVIFVEVDLSKNNNVFATDKKDAVMDVGVEARRCRCRGRGKYTLCC